MKNLVLDIGNVICEWNPRRLIGEIFPADQYQQVYDVTIGHADWLALDKGTLTLEDAIGNAQRRSDLPSDGLARIYHNTPASLTPLPGIDEAIKAVHDAGISLYALSNMQAHGWAWLQQNLPFWSLFDGVVISCEIKMIKPQPEIFQYLLNRWQLKAGETLFIDDMAVNVEAARAQGLQGLVMEEPQRSAAVITALVGRQR